MADKFKYDYTKISACTTTLNQNISDLILEMNDIVNASNTMHGTWIGSAGEASAEACEALLQKLAKNINALSEWKSQHELSSQYATCVEKEFVKTFAPIIEQGGAAK